MWGEQDSNHLRSRKTTELQSVPFGRSGISPKSYYILMNAAVFFEPKWGTRTHDLLITNLATLAS